MPQSAGHLGGDLVGQFPADLNHLGIYASDVTGQGIRSVFMNARIAGSLSSDSVAQNMSLHYDDKEWVQVLPSVVVISKLNRKAPAGCM